MGLEELKKKYTETIKREQKAEEWANQATDEEFNKWLPAFNKIIVELSRMMFQFKELAGREMTKEEALEGFK